MTTIAEVRQAVADVLSGLTGIDGKKLTGYPWPPRTVNEPAAIVSPADGEFLTYRSSQTSQDLSLVIAVVVQFGDTESAHQQLDAYLDDNGPQSIYDAFAVDPTMGGVVDDISVVSASNYGQIVYNGVDYYGFELQVEVLR